MMYFSNVGQEMWSLGKGHEFLESFNYPASRYAINPLIVINERRPGDVCTVTWLNIAELCDC